MLKVTRNRLYVVPVLMSSLDVLELLSGSAVPLKMYDISDATGVPLSTIYRILQTLVHRGYLAHDTEAKYSLANPAEMMSAFRKRR